MKKSTLIATFLVNLKSGITLEQAEHVVLETFVEKHPNKKFQEWNNELQDAWCENVIRSNPSPGRVDVGQFILSLWDEQ